MNPETWALSKSDFFMKDPTGRDAREIAFGSTLSNDRHADRRFDYLIANPPYGKDWKRDKAAVKAEHERGAAGRFGPGLPRISDGQTLFLLHMLARAKAPAEGGIRIAIIMNGSPLFTGDAGSGESEIRRHIIENDLLEALIALPEQLFYNTGIGTYIWLLTNRKAPERAGKIQLIDATSFWSPLKKSLGNKRRDIPPEKAADILELLRGFGDGEARTVREDGEDEEVIVSRLFPTTRFGFRKITVERPLRLNFQASEDRIARLDDQRAFANLAKSRRRGEAGERARAEGRAFQDSIRNALRCMCDTLHKDRDAFVAELNAAVKRADIKLRAPIRKAILAALSERDETAAICRDRRGLPEPDPGLRDTERVPLPDGADPVDEVGIPASVQEFFDREVKPHAPDACINTSKRDARDGHVGLVGYEINFNRYFYRFKPPRPLGEIEADIRRIEREMVTMLREVAGDIVRFGAGRSLTGSHEDEKLSASSRNCRHFLIRTRDDRGNHDCISPCRGGSRQLLPPMRRGSSRHQLPAASPAGGAGTGRARGMGPLPKDARRHHEAPYTRRGVRAGSAGGGLPAHGPGGARHRHSETAPRLDRNPPQSESPNPGKAAGADHALQFGRAHLRGGGHAFRGCPGKDHDASAHGRGLFPVPEQDRTRTSTRSAA